MAKVGFDLDGVLFDFSKSLSAFLLDHCSWNEELISPPTRWEFYKDWGLSLEDFLDTCHKAADLGKLWFGPVFDHSAVDEMTKLQKSGHSIHIITHRHFGSHPGVSASATAVWLRHHAIPYDTLTFSDDKTIIKTDWMIEDNVDNYLALERAGCRSVLIDRPWNHHLENARRVSSVPEFVGLVMEGLG